MAIGTRSKAVWLLAALITALVGIDGSYAASAPPKDSKTCLHAMDKAISALAAKRYKSSVPVIQSYAKAGCPQAKLFLGLMYAEGDGVPRDCLKGVRMIEALAYQFYNDAQIYLGRLYEHGRCKDRSVVIAYRWYAIAAAHPYKSDSRESARDLRRAKQTLLSDAEIRTGDVLAIRWWQFKWKK